MAGDREIGTVKRFDPDRNFGFIGRREGGDVFVHQSDVERAGLGTLNPGDSVSFTVEKTDKGPRARNLQRAQPEAHPQQPPPRQPTRPITTTTFQFGPDYLCDGYFEERQGKPYLRPQVVDTLAVDVAKVLGSQGMRSAQLRRFFNKVRSIETKLDLSKDFEAVKADLYGLKRDAAYQVGRKVVPEAFQAFIDRNVQLAVESEMGFRQGFLQHFESVLAYFVYFFRES